MRAGGLSMVVILAQRSILIVLRVLSAEMGWFVWLKLTVPTAKSYFTPSDHITSGVDPWVVRMCGHRKGNCCVSRCYHLVITVWGNSLH